MGQRQSQQASVHTSAERQGSGGRRSSNKPVHLQAIFLEIPRKSGSRECERRSQSPANYRSYAPKAFDPLPQRHRSPPLQGRNPGRSPSRTARTVIHTNPDTVALLLDTQDWMCLLRKFLNNAQGSITAGDDPQSTKVEQFEGDRKTRAGSPSDASSLTRTPREFAAHVYNSVLYHTSCIPKKTRKHHCFFVFHPEASWHRDFSALVQREPLSQMFLGMSDNLENLVLWMQFLRQHAQKQQHDEQGQDLTFHLIIPAYRPMVIKSQLSIPDLGNLAIHGDVHDAMPMVYVDMPTVADYSAGSIVLENVINLAAAAAETQAAGVAPKYAVTADVTATSSASPCRSSSWGVHSKSSASVLLDKTPGTGQWAQPPRQHGGKGVARPIEPKTRKKARRIHYFAERSSNLLLV